MNLKMKSLAFCLCFALYWCWLVTDMKIELLCQGEEKAGWLQGVRSRTASLGTLWPEWLGISCLPSFRPCLCSCIPGEHCHWPNLGLGGSCLGRPPEPLWRGSFPPGKRSRAKKAAIADTVSVPCPWGGWGLPSLISSHPHRALEGGSTDCFHFTSEEPEVVVSPGSWGQDTAPKPPGCSCSHPWL